MGKARLSCLNRPNLPLRVWKPLPLLRSPLTEYLAERGIPYAIASRYCCRLNYGVRGKRYFAVGFPNVAGGYEIRSRYFKGCVPPKDVSLVKMESSPADVCSVFEGFMDFLSAVTLGLEPERDCLVLNSVANVEKAAGFWTDTGASTASSTVTKPDGGRLPHC